MKFKGFSRPITEFKGFSRSRPNLRVFQGLCEPCKLKSILPKNILFTIYNSLLLPHLTYGVCCWGFNHALRLKTLQKKAIRSITQAPYLSHTEPLCKNNNLLLFDDLFKINCLRFFYNFSNGQIPSYFKCFNMTLLSDDQLAERRIVNTPPQFLGFFTTLPTLCPIIPIPTSQTKSAQKCIRFFLPSLLNSKFLPMTCLSKIKTHSSKGFINYTKSYILSQYTDCCRIPNCYVCNL